MALYFGNVHCLRSLVSLRNLKFHGLTFVKSLKTVTLDSCIVDKDISATFFLNETITLRIIEPLDLSSCHQLDLRRCFLAANFKARSLFVTSFEIRIIKPQFL